MNIEDLFVLYREKFIPIYADYIALTLKKPKQILIEQENILAHLSQFTNQDLEQSIRDENLTKAYNHLIRVILDMHKLVWAETKEILDSFVLNGQKRLAFNLRESDVLQLYEQFIKKARSARLFETSHVGNDLIESINRYEEVNIIGNELLGKLDEIKVQVITHWTKVFKTKEFAIGVAASLAASVFYGCFM